jgi:hypothetical protein
VTQATVFVKVPRKNLTEETSQIVFHIEAKDKSGQVYKSSRDSIFIGPRI